MAKEINSVRTRHTSTTKKQTIKLFGVEISVNNVSSSEEKPRRGMEGRNLMSSSSKGNDSSSGEGSTSVTSKGRWSEEEQRAFLIGLEKLGKGSWSGIARDFVPSRTPTQVASHAQKYFDRQKENRELTSQKSSVFDINLDQQSSNACLELVSKRVVVPLKENNNKGKEPLNQESPISPMPASYRVPNNVVHTASLVSFNGNYAYAYLPMTSYQFSAPNFVSSSTNATSVHRGSSQSNSASMDNLDLTL